MMVSGDWTSQRSSALDESPGQDLHDGITVSLSVPAPRKHHERIQLKRGSHHASTLILGLQTSEP